MEQPGWLEELEGQNETLRRRVADLEAALDIAQKALTKSNPTVWYICPLCLRPAVRPLTPGAEQ